MSYNALVPSGIPALPVLALRELNIAGNAFQGALPESVSWCTALRRLDVSKTGLQQLPAWIAELSALTELIADDNASLSSLATVDWARLPSLQTLSVRASSLTGLQEQFPPSLFTATSLSALHLDDAPVAPRAFNLLEGVKDFEERRRQRLARGGRVQE